MFTSTFGNFVLLTPHYTSPDNSQATLPPDREFSKSKRESSEGEDKAIAFSNITKVLFVG